MLTRKKPMKRTGFKPKQAHPWRTVARGAFNRKYATALPAHRKTPLAALERRLDGLWQQVVKRGIPQHQRGQWEAAHIVTRKFKSTRWAANNGVPLLIRDHRYYHHNVKEWETYNRNRMGDAEYDALILQSNTPVCVTEAFLLEQESKLKEILNAQ